MLSREERESLDIDSKIYLCYDYIFAISKDRVLATHGASISLIKLSGEIICTHDSIYAPTYPSSTHFNEDEQVEEAEYSFLDDILIFVDDGKKGMMNYDGKIILEAIYSDITFPTCQQAEVML